MEKSIDWKSDNAAQILFKELDEMAGGKNTNKININHIVSQEFCELLDVNDVTDFNGWQCDWWSEFDYHGVRFAVYGGAWYGTIEISLPE